ncbi:MAG: hypothetical protein NWQ47_02570 [Crocinitomicaceae bacterium]|jgi:hypothetical protein|nr:hypothetical protein [Crocinitomicaceae bacterium]MDP5010099.1 hypothetical protein [Crocinitomicaceae bacterium]
MKKYIILLVLLMSSLVYSQENSKLTVSLGDQFSLGVPINNMYNCYKFKLGLRLNHFEFYTSYDYGGQFNYTDHGKSGFNDYNYSQLGAGLKYYYLKEKDFNLFATINITTQVGSKYKNSLLGSNDLRTNEQSSSSLSELSLYHSHYFQSYEEYDSWIGNIYYQSTSLIATFLIGFDFKLYKELYLNFGIGAGMRNIKVITPVSRQNKTYLVFSTDAQLSLTYQIPLILRD